MTVYLNHVINSGDVNAELIRDIADRVKLQLSDYAFQRLFPNQQRPETTNRYINDEQLANQRKGIYMYLMKSKQKCKFLWNDKEYSGMIEEGENHEYRIKLDNGEYLDADLNDVDFIIEKLDYQ